MTFTAESANQQLEQICSKAPIVPVLVVEDVAHAEPLARALVAGGLPVLEVTLRTKAALDVIRAMSSVEGGIVGAGTVLCRDDVKASKEAGARFAVSPGATDALIEACEEFSLPLLAGVATASEGMALLERGYRFAKFFPAEAAGGAALLKALNGPLPQLKFCPTGGLTPDNARSYLGLPNVVCAGGSWVAPKALMQAGQWREIEILAREAAGF
ncbi:bifunctional 4-hydroxy-2-oxoglutarate aldolase/2-dehydro-3-deoxy-phosphogluconate aldolase [Kiloniella sp. b19]|uniref:bifunctional 4-hydroxy-2-oxoglutarate aldolase/2-dehydro-3-deoxy-phosphogluconate aldolase n=1 Tax=Kiloniella sp. GXU_MW_B19 TaxID=3141326 RepID=UPI0031D66264